MPTEPHKPLAPLRALTLVEVLVALAILLGGILAVASLIPANLRRTQNTVDRSQAAFLAQMKAEEVRRDNYDTGGGNTFIDEIRSMTPPSTPTLAVEFPLDPKFSYSFWGASVVDPTDNPGVARVIVRYSPNYRPSSEVLYELEF